MRADRLLSILLTLQVRQRVTARELAARLDVSERTVYRDMEALSAAGVPVYAERGAGGGWALLEEYRTNLTGLNEMELQALFFTGPARLLADLGLAKASEAALIKLMAALPSTARRDAEDFRQRIYVDMPGWYRTAEAVPALATLQAAIWQDRRLLMTYQRGDGATVERTVDPLGLVAKGSTWYLIAAVADVARTYRVVRIQQATLLDERCVRPDGFDLATYWRQSSAEFRANLPRYPVTVRLAPHAVAYLRQMTRYLGSEPTETPDRDGWVTATLEFEIEAEATQCILGLGDQVEVLEPCALRRKVIELAAGVVAFYETRAQAKRGA